MTATLNRWAYLALQGAIGSCVSRYYREFLRLERSPGELEGTHESRLRNTLESALCAPYYRERVAHTTHLRLENFPIVSRADVLGSFDEFLSDDFRHNRGVSRATRPQRWARVTTGGSSGAPVAVIHGARYRERGRAARMYSQYLCGFPFGTPYIRLWGSMRDINATRQSMAARVTDALARATLLNGFRQDPTTLRRHLYVIDTSGVRHMMAYADAVTELARFATDEKISVRPLFSVMSCAGTLTADMRALVSRTFGARVHNKYGSRECAEIACECEAGSLHVYSNNVAIEIVDANGTPVGVGERGRIVVTLLDNPEWPLVRYDIGDIGVSGHDRCACGRAFPTLESVEGRAIEMITDVAGAPVSPVFIRHIIGVVHHRAWIRRYRLTQRAGSYDLRIQVDGADDAAVEEFRSRLEPDLRSVLGAHADIVIRTGVEDDGRDKWLWSVNVNARDAGHSQ